LRVAVIHNLARGGARRRLEQQLRHLDGDVVEVCLDGASPVTEDPVVVPFRELATRAPRAIRPPLRYADLARLSRSWRRVADEIVRIQPDVVLANPCRFLQAPPALLHVPGPSLYFCDEPRASDRDPWIRASRNPVTSGVYRGLYAAQRSLDRSATLAATRLATNSRYTAAQISAAYGRTVEVLPMGVPGTFTATFPPPKHLLSVGHLIPAKGHDLVVQSAARAKRRWPVVIVAPRPAPAAERQLRELASALGVPLTVRTGIEDTELVEAYRGALVTLYLAHQEPFGLASLEAQACGSPVIVARGGGLPETLIEGVTGFAVTRESGEAAAAIDVLGDDARRGRMAHAASQHGSAYPWSRAGTALEHSLRSLVAVSAYCAR
jgi:glycosyltransferase involved in cell wall biosynthesis